MVISKYKIFFFIFCCLFLSVFSLFPESIVEADNLAKEGQAGKALEIYYNLLEKTETLTDRELISLLDRIIIHENSINKIYTLADNFFDKIKISADRSRFFEKAAEISELSGYIEKAAYYYEKAYSANPAEENNYLLINSAVLTLETGDLEKAQYLAELAAGKTRTAELIDKAALIMIKIDLNNGNYENAVKKIETIINKKNISDYILISAYRISDQYFLNIIKDRTYKLLKERFTEEAVNNLLLYKTQISPFLYFSVPPEDISREEEEIKEKTAGVYAYIQTGSFEKPGNAEDMIKKLEKIGFEAVIKPSVFNNKNIFKVLIPAYTQKEAEYINIKLKENSIESFLIFN